VPNSFANRAPGVGTTSLKVQKVSDEDKRGKKWNARCRTRTSLLLISFGFYQGWGLAHSRFRQTHGEWEGDELNLYSNLNFLGTRRAIESYMALKAIGQLGRVAILEAEAG
jgi:hypothetical protein